MAAVADFAEEEFGAGVGAALLEGAGVAGGGDGGERVEDLVDGVGVGGGDGGVEEADAVEVGADGDVPVLQGAAEPVVGLVGFDAGDEFVQPATEEFHGFADRDVDDQGVQQLFGGVAGEPEQGFVDAGGAGLVDVSGLPGVPGVGGFVFESAGDADGAGRRCVCWL